MSKNIPCEEIQQLKRANFWLCRDRVKVKNLMREKLESVVELNKSMKQMEYRYLKESTKQRNKLLDEHDCFVNLYMRINEDIHTNGIKIMKLRGLHMNTEDSFSDVKKQVDYEKFVCVLCLESYSVRCYGEDINNPVTAYYLNDWNYKGDRVRICSNCFYYG